MISCTNVHTTCTSERGTELIRVSENCTRWLVTLLEPLFAEASSRAACVQATLKKITAEKRALGKTASKANGKKMAAAMKKAGKGIFAPKKLSDALAAVCGAKTLPRTEVTKKVPASLMTESLQQESIGKFYTIIESATTEPFHNRIESNSSRA